MIEGQRMDLDKTRYKTFEELELYCYRVAGTVGLMTQNVIGIDTAYTNAPWSKCVRLLWSISFLIYLIKLISDD